jgi:hypothetical protein
VLATYAPYHAELPLAYHARALHVKYTRNLRLFTTEEVGWQKSF